MFAEPLDNTTELAECISESGLQESVRIGCRLRNTPMVGFRQVFEAHRNAIYCNG